MSAPALDWTDPTDEENTTRGFLGTIDPCIIRNAKGDVVWDAERWSFLDADTPDTANPSLWRMSRLVRRHGLFEVVPGVYQVRGFCVSNMTMSARLRRMRSSCGWAQQEFAALTCTITCMDVSALLSYASP